MANCNNSDKRIVKFGPRQVNFPSGNLGLLIDSTLEYKERNFAALHENLDRDGYM